MAKHLMPNRGWWFAGAGVITAWILDRIEAPLSWALLTLGVFLVVGLAWPWIQETRARRRRAVILLAAYVIVTAWVVHSSRSQPPPPIAVTGVIVQPPFEAGKPLRISIEMVSEVSGLKIRGWNYTAVGVADDNALSEARRPANEEKLWQAYKEKARRAGPLELTAIKGTMNTPLLGPVLTAGDVEALGSANGIVYSLGQVDYGSGALDYCVYFRPSIGGRGTLCVEHNGPSVNRAEFRR